jgi:hypothetical protein
MTRLPNGYSALNDYKLWSHVCVCCVCVCACACARYWAPLACIEYCKEGRKDDGATFLCVLMAVITAP